MTEYASTAKVNEKIDVYSFGVVLLELVTGREANCGDDEHTNLAQWAWKQFKEDTAMECVVDEEIRVQCDTAQVSTVFKLGLMCTATLPSSRPTMKKVLEILRRCSRQEGHAMGNKVHPAAPLLLNATYPATHKHCEKEIDHAQGVHILVDQ